MPLLQIRKINNATYLGIWEITETPEILQQQLISLAGKQLQIANYSSITRQSQWLGSRLLAYTLLQKFTSIPITLQNDGLGKPVFEHETYRISISHCQKLVAVIISDSFEVGIDIEFISPKVMRIKDKFLAETEKADTGNDLEKTLIYWSTKETLYKIYSKKQLLFKEHLKLNPFVKWETETLTAQIQAPDFHKYYCVNYEKIEDYILTFCIDN